MGHSVVAEGVPLRYHTLDERLLALGVVARQKEYRVDVLFLQCVENARGIAVFIALIERDDYPFLICRQGEGIKVAVSGVELQGVGRTIERVHRRSLPVAYPCAVRGADRYRRQNSRSKERRRSRSYLSHKRLFSFEVLQNHSANVVCDSVCKI